MPVNSVRAQDEGFGDLLVGQAVGNQTQHLNLTFGDLTAVPTSPSRPDLPTQVRRLVERRTGPEGLEIVRSRRNLLLSSAHVPGAQQYCREG